MKKLGAMKTMKDLTFLTRDGCVNTPAMVKNLEGAFAAMELPHDYVLVDLGMLPRNDSRIGYPTPTILWKGRDIFGMSVPKARYHAPS